LVWHVVDHEASEAEKDNDGSESGQMHVNSISHFVFIVETVVDSL
jgi:hypothetical protein